MRRLPPLLLALVLGLLAALAVACGDDDDDRRLLSPSRAADIREELDTIAERVQKGECADLDPAFVRLERAVDGLPRGTDRRLRARLADGVAHLREIAPEECSDNRPETTTTETEPETIPETTPETTPPDTTTAPPPDTTTQPPPDTTTDPPPVETLPQDPGDSGGSEAPDANFVPPGQARKGSKSS
ncbi:MAG TPA: hypothetical protein VHF89_07380 [Solirubrobacteraceae bacterium]|nr:hypothetical protein [Solirubrobacteraceae bacterium]